MVCPQNDTLVKWGILVDSFVVLQEKVTAFFLTHAHSDHMNGLTKHFGKKYDKFQAPIYCSHITKQMVQCRFPGLDDSYFCVLSFGKWHKLNEKVKVMAIQANHTMGSMMVLFNVQGFNILYTGDFRFYNGLTHVEEIHDIDILYYDDTFLELTMNIPTYRQTVDKMEQELIQPRLSKKPIYVQGRILGIEIILRQLAKRNDVSFQLSPYLQDSWRGKQLSILLKQFMNHESKTHIVIGDIKYDKVEQDAVWILPSCTNFLCAEPAESTQKKKLIPFCTHSNRKEIEQLKVIVNAKHVNACQVKIPLEELSC